MQELGLESANSIGDGALSLDLLLLGAHHEARVAEFERASELLEEAAQLVAEQQRDGIREVQIGVNRLHLDRLAGLHSSDEIDARCEGVLQAYDAIPPGRLDAYPQLLRTLTEELGYQRPELVRALLISRELSAAQAILPRFSDVIERWTRLDEGVVPLVERAARQIEGGADDATRLEACSVLLSQLATTFDVPAQVATEIVRILRDEGQETSGLSRNVELAL